MNTSHIGLINIKRFLLLFLVIIICLSITGCNKKIFDTTYSFNKAVLILPNGEVVEGKVQSWTDFEDGDQVQVKINGTTYLIHSSNIALISE